KQMCASYPDSTSTSFDKLNVRNGTYPIWGPLHLTAKVGADKKPVDANVAKIIGYFTDPKSAPQGVDMVALEAAGGHTIPQCAMSVDRVGEVDGTPSTGLTSYKAPEPCNCAFDVAVSADNAKNCKKCMAPADCGANELCSYGYCEAK